MRYVIGIAGLKRSGKDTFARVLREVAVERGFAFVTVAFADPLRQAAAAAYGVDVYAFTDDARKDEVCPAWGITHRQMLLNLGVPYCRARRAPAQRGGCGARRGRRQRARAAAGRRVERARDRAARGSLAGARSAKLRGAVADPRPQAGGLVPGGVHAQRLRRGDLQRRRRGGAAPARRACA